MDSVPHLKRCTKCGDDKPLSDYYTDKRYADGWYPWCTECRRAYRKARNADPIKRAHDSARMLAWVKTTPSEQERRKRYDRERWQNPEVRQRKTAFDKKRMQDPIKRARKTKMHRLWHHRRFRADPEYRAQHRWRKRQETHLRRVQKQENGGKITRKQWRELCRQFNHRCASCSRKTKLTMDHIVPLSKGGAHSIENIQPLCMTCNQKKHTKTIKYQCIVQLTLELDI